MFQITEYFLFYIYFISLQRSLHLTLCKSAQIANTNKYQKTFGMW